MPRCKSAASAVRRIARHGTPCRSSERTGAYPLTAMGLRRGTTRLPGKKAWRRQRPGRGAAYRAGRGEIPVVPDESGDARRGCAEWLAGQMSKDTPRLLHATAREHASRAMPHIVRDPDVLEVKASGRPSAVLILVLSGDC